MIVDLDPAADLRDFDQQSGDWKRTRQTEWMGAIVTHIHEPHLHPVGVCVMFESLITRWYKHDGRQVLLIKNVLEPMSFAFWTSFVGFNWKEKLKQSDGLHYHQRRLTTCNSVDCLLWILRRFSFVSKGSVLVSVRTQENNNWPVSIAYKSIITV